MSFLAPERLWLLIAVAALAVAYVLLQRRRPRYAMRFTNLALLDRVAPRRPGWRRHLPAGLFLLMLVLLVTGFARPAAEVRVPRERATVMVVFDTSPSMEAVDVAPSRLLAARNAAHAFIDQLPLRFNVGLVTFSGSAAVIVPPTLDRDAVLASVERLEATGQGTAIGDAIVTALGAIANFDAQNNAAQNNAAQNNAAQDNRAADPPPARIVLLSDGGNTAGASPRAGAAEAAAAGVPVSTIAYGTPGGTVEIQGRSIPVPADGPTLRQVAEETGGTFYEAASGEELRQVYEDIGSSVGYRTERREISARFIGLALAAAAAAAAASLTWFARLP
jgi:Ca-activated chloride channel family protein